VTFIPTVVVGPSGVGKGTVIAQVLAMCPQVWLSVSATTRAPRPGEVNGKHYFFVSEPEFSDLIEHDGLLEWATYQGHRYGTPRQAVIEKVEQGRAVLLEIEVQGARQVLERLRPVRSVFLAPPSWADLEKRLRGRGTEPESVIEQRLVTAREELAFRDHCDHVIVNREVASSAAELVNFIGLGLTSDQAH
jgi:guanylate kinase